ncbi:ATP-binding cassette domain-containing protein [Gammaproteobacteria bacterium]|nr:ATP-binding cassette domain-containing protein [Gammaproteobacteria bacterium]
MNTITIKNLKLKVPSSEHAYSLKHIFLQKKNILSYNTILNIKSFSAKLGDKICVVGRNGQGKTTFMKILAGIYSPSEGEIFISDEPTVVLASGIGMEDDLPVIDCIKTALLIRGLSDKKIIAAKVVEILKFCELEHDQFKLFKHLSTGFKSRLAFTIAINEDPRILLLDEVLGGGDEFFMKKATIKLRQCIESSDTAIISTHGPDDIKELCNKLIIIDKGQIVYDGDYEVGLKKYREDFG